MFCDEALDAVEAIAAGDLTPDGRVAEHLTSVGATPPATLVEVTRLAVTGMVVEIDGLALA